MLKAVLIDDEYIVLEGLQDNIDWAGYGIELAGTAGNGLEGLELIRREKPDIVMTDIRMPGLNGLQLIEQVMHEEPGTMCIVFSGFNEFDYIKTAMKLDVVDYLEKPVTIEKVEEALARAMRKLGQRQQVRALEDRLAESREELLAKAAMDLLLGAEGADRFRACLGEEADRVEAFSVLAFPSSPHVFCAQLSCRHIVMKPGAEWAVLLAHAEWPVETVWEELASATADMTETFGSGQTYRDASDARKSYLEAQRALRYGRFLEEPGWVRIEHVGEASADPGGMSEREEAILFHMRTNDKAGLIEQLEAFNGWMAGERLDPERAEEEILKLAYIGMQVMKEMGIDSRPSGKMSAVQHRELSGMHDREAMFAWLRRHIETLMQWAEEARRAPKHQPIEKAQDYIRQHYHLDLSLQDVADHVGMNATYFSLLFKEKTGTSYIKYVTRIRLEHAKTLLRSGLKVNEVCEKVGYYKYRHFTELFKKHYGYTPSQYREQHELKHGGG
ncbi:helix-turn-helix domain-containing protein [Paenibacillus methanolicus]|uniref:Two-component system response regulator YesN n=1 Tax=Paenibacillus methanolicus TaxID=582686 RepID=A0A5S5C136_9BACL|nr:helix-turn-helix domain-containing protein [Paenibacillus methanolicus]TYP73141.1 two-component system response regulator YesN [Paenibacillus methanolicus]